MTEQRVRHAVKVNHDQESDYSKIYEESAEDEVMQ